MPASPSEALVSSDNSADNSAEDPAGRFHLTGVESSESKALWVDALPAKDLHAKGRALVKRNGKQIALFATPSGIRAIANRCPHEGYPLSEGTMDADGCTLTCNWHNWKFALDTGVESSGGDAVRTFPVEVTDGMVRVDIADPPPEVRIDRALTNLKAAFDRFEYDRFAREIARIAVAGGDPLDAVRCAFRWTVDRFEWGMTHAMAAAPDWIAVYDAAETVEDRIAAVAEIIGHLCDDSLRMPVFAFAQGSEPWDEDAFVAAVEAEDEATSVRLVRGGLERGGWALIDRGLARAALAHYQDFGHSAIYTEKSREAVERLGDDAAEPYALALARALVTARREDLIPEFKAYRPAREAWTGRGKAKPKPADFCKASVSKAMERVNAASGDVDRLYDALLEAASWQLVRADPVYAGRIAQPISQNVSRLEFSHALTFANAGRRIAARHPDLWPDVLLQIACFLGRNSAYVDPGRDCAEWKVPDPEAFLAERATNIIDHGHPEFIVSSHFVKMTFAVRDEVATKPNATWVPALVAALNRFLNEPLKWKHTRRSAYQALRTVEGE